MLAQSNTTRLKPLLEGFVEVTSDKDRQISAITADSRRVTPDCLFVAVPGHRHDGREYIQQAIDSGASAVIYENQEYHLDDEIKVPAFGIANLGTEQGKIASRFFRHPSQNMLIVGVTGTNGKTTCAYLLAQSFELLGKRCGFLGTIGLGLTDGLISSDLTTIDAIGNQEILGELYKQGAKVVCMEVSSHGIDQGRVSGIGFDVAVFTNLTREHLDYHGSMTAYKASKMLLFDWDSLHHRVVNLDDDFGRELAEGDHQGKCWRYGLESGDVFADIVSILPDGIELSIQWGGKSYRLKSNLIGRINVANILAVFTTLLASGESAEDIQHIFSKLRPPPGRMELFKGDRDQPDVVVDYAHTPDALKQSLISLREHYRGQLSVVFGCGGNRDRGKRAQMGQISERHSDHVVITNDNPRNEAPEKIVADIVQSMSTRADIIYDRREAICSAFRKAKSGDIVLIAGKGHETTQTIAGEKLAFDDRKIADELTGAMMRGIIQ